MRRSRRVICDRWDSKDKANDRDQVSRTPNNAVTYPNLSAQGKDAGVSGTEPCSELLEAPFVLLLDQLHVFDIERILQVPQSDAFRGTPEAVDFQVAVKNSSAAMTTFMHSSVIENFIASSAFSTG